MKIYVASPWAEREYAKHVRERCRAEGIEVTSRWLDSPGGNLGIGSEEEARADYEDVRKADALLLLNLQKRGEETSGKAVETGLAIAWGKPVYMVGEVSNVFHFHPLVKRFGSVELAVDAMLGGVHAS